MPRPIVLPRPCVNCGKVFEPLKRQPSGRVVRDNSRKCCSPECRQAWRSNDETRKAKISAAVKGAKHPNWQGGKSYFNRISKRGPDWVAAAAKARKRDNNSCVDCGKSEEANGRKLDVHHIIPFHEFQTAKEANRLENLATLCKKCHRKREAKITGQQMTLSLSGKRSGHQGRVRGHKINTAKLNEEQVMQIRLAADTGAVLKVLAKQFECSASNISGIVKGQTWRHLPMAKTAGEKRQSQLAPKGELCGGATITERHARAVKLLHVTIKNVREIARRVGVTNAIAYQIISGKTWGHVLSVV